MTNGRRMPAAVVLLLGVGIGIVLGVWGARRGHDSVERIEKTHGKPRSKVADLVKPPPAVERIRVAHDGWTHQELFSHLRSKGLAFTESPSHNWGILGPSMSMRINSNIVLAVLTKTPDVAREYAAATPNCAAWNRFLFRSDADPRLLKTILAKLP